MAKTKTAKSGKTATYQLYARLDATTVVKVGPPTRAPFWKATAMVGMLLERPDVQNAWHKTVAALWSPPSWPP